MVEDAVRQAGHRLDAIGEPHPGTIDPADAESVKEWYYYLTSRELASAEMMPGGEGRSDSSKEPG